MNFEKLDKVSIPQNGANLLDKWGIQEEYCTFESPQGLKVQTISLVTPIAKGVIQFDGSRYRNYIVFSVDGDKIKLEFGSKEETVVKIQYSMKSKMISKVETNDEYHFIYVGKQNTLKEITVMRHVLFAFVSIMQYIHQFRQEGDKVYIETIKREIVKKNKNGKIKNRKISKITHYKLSVSKDILTPEKPLVYVANEDYELNLEIPVQEESQTIETYTVKGYWRTLKNGNKKWVAPYTRKKVVSH